MTETLDHRTILPEDYPGPVDLSSKQPDIQPLTTDQSLQITGADEPFENLAGRAVDVVLQHEMKRRGFLGGMAKGVGMSALRNLPLVTVGNAALAYKAHRYAESHYPKVPASYNWLTDYVPNVHNEVVIFFPGTGDLHAKGETKSLYEEPELRHSALGFVDYSHQRTNKDELVDRITDALAPDPPKYISYVGRSAGGIIGFDVIPRVAERLGIVVKRFALISAPGSYKDADFGVTAAALDSIFPDWDWIDEYAQAITTFCQQMQYNGILPVVTNFERAKRTFTHGEDGVALRSEFHMIATTNIKSKEGIDRWKRVTDPKVTSGRYVSSRHPRTDVTVHDQHSFNEFDEVAHEIGIPFGWLKAIFDGHAEMDPSIEAMGKWLHVTAPTQPKSLVLADSAR